jgi:hypothetical protein
MKYNAFLISMLIGFSLLTISCEKIDVPKGTPRCVKKKIRKENDKCLDKVFKYNYQGDDVYLFVPGNCPDALYELYDGNCNLICSPSGGISGEGDGECPGFFEEATGEVVIWSN